MFLLLFTGVGLEEIYVTKKKKCTALFCHWLVHSLYLEQLSHLLLLKVNSVSEVSGDKKNIFI